MPRRRSLICCSLLLQPALLLATKTINAQGPLPGQSIGQSTAQPLLPQNYAPPTGAQQPAGVQPGSHPFAGPTQPIVPTTPGGQRVIRPPVMRNAPFQLAEQEFANLKAVLAAWEQRSGKIDLLRCNIELLEYDLTFPITAPPVKPGQPKQVLPNHQWQGELKYQQPDKGWFEAKTINQNNAPDFISQDQKWVVDGKSVYQFDFQGRKVIRRDLPPELQGAGIGNGPLPFFIGAKADRLLHRYFMRLTTPAQIADRQIWIEAYPRYQFDASNFRRATIILDRQTVMPLAVETYSPSGNERSVHKFSGAQVGRNVLERVFNADLFRVEVPSGWQMIANPGANPSHAARAPGPAQKR